MGGWRRRYPLRKAESSDRGHGRDRPPGAALLLRRGHARGPSRSGELRLQGGAASGSPQRHLRPAGPRTGQAPAPRRTAAGASVEHTGERSGLPCPPGRAGPADRRDGAPARIPPRLQVARRGAQRPSARGGTRRRSSRGRGTPADPAAGSAGQPDGPKHQHLLRGHHAAAFRHRELGDGPELPGQRSRGGKSRQCGRRRRHRLGRLPTPRSLRPAVAGAPAG